MQKDCLRIWVMPSYTNSSTLSTKHIGFLENLLDIDVRVTFVSWREALREYYNLFKNSAPPDVIQIGTTWISTLSHMGYLDPVPEHLRDKSFLEPWIKEEAFFMKEMMALPWLIESPMLLARRDIVDLLKIKPDDLKTLNGFKDVCAKIYEAHTKDKERIPHPFAFSLRAETGKLHQLISWFWAMGYSLPDLNNMPETPFELDQLIPSLDYFKSLFIASHTTAEEVSASRQTLNDWFYSDGTYCFNVDHWYSVTMSIASDNKTKIYPLEYDVFEMPSGANGPTPKGSGSMLGVSSLSMHKEKAWQAIDYLLSEAYLEERILLCGDTPAIETNFWKTYSENSSLKLIRQQIKNAKTYPKHPLWASYERVLNEGLTKLLWLYITAENSLPELNNTLKSMNRKFTELSNLAWELNQHGR